MRGSGFHRSPTSNRSLGGHDRKLNFRDGSLLLRCCRCSLGYPHMLRDSFYFLVALLSLAVMIGWLSFVTLAGLV